MGIPIKREVKKLYDSGSSIKLIDLGDGDKIEVEAYIKKRGTTQGFNCKRTDLLDLFVALWPDEIAYTFKSNNEET